MNNDILRNLEYITWSTTVLIVVLTIIISLYINHIKKNDDLIKKRRWIENLPSLISTLGVIGTFAGITIGLINFNTSDLDNSIPLLLEGLKTAFFTSLAGMIGSLILTRQVSADFDQHDSGVSDINIAAGEIVKAVESMSQATNQMISRLMEVTSQQMNNQSAFYNTALSVLQKLDQNSSQTQSNLSSILLQSTSLNTSMESILQSVGNVEEKTTTFQTNSVNLLTQVGKNLAHMEESIGEIIDVASAMQSTQEDVASEVKTFGSKLHGEVLEIEDKMNETSELLKIKFDEFAELLKKSNTEALVEVMKKVTEEFQKQMNALINKLIQENFDQLNKSVERLNTWQQENKEMISSLTVQYKEMTQNFEETSTALTKVGADTKELVSDGGKLKKLIESLNEVLIKDENFKEITRNLTSTVTLTKSNMEMFDESTQALNEWVRKQRNFVDGVQMLIQKLEELDKIRDYGEHFWKDTKKKLEEGVSFISDGSKQLNQQLTVLDQRFYERLSATLAELDTCIQAMVNANRR